MKKLIKEIILLTIALASINSNLIAQVSFKTKLTEGSSLFAILADNEQKPATAENEQSLLSQFTKGSKDVTFENVGDYRDELNFTHKKFQVYFKGIEVIGIDFVIHEKAGKIRYTNGTFENIEDLSTLPSVSVPIAEKKSTEFLNNKAGAKGLSSILGKISGYAL